jgi:hypothetical protein
MALVNNLLAANYYRTRFGVKCPTHNLTATNAHVMLTGNMQLSSIRCQLSYFSRLAGEACLPWRDGLFSVNNPTARRERLFGRSSAAIQQRHVAHPRRLAFAYAPASRRRRRERQQAIRLNGDPP